MTFLEFLARQQNCTLLEAEQDLNLRDALVQHQAAFIRSCMSEYDRLCREAVSVAPGDQCRWATLRGKAEAYYELAQQVPNLNKVIEDLFLQYQEQNFEESAQ